MGLKLKNGASGAWRLFTLAKNLSGREDHIYRDDLKRWALELGVSEVNFNRWITIARNRGWFEDTQRLDGRWVIILCSKKSLGKIGPAVSMPVQRLFSEVWRAHLFAHWQAAFTNNGDRLVSQKKQAQITGIDPQMQSKYNKAAGVKSTSNYAESNINANGIDAVREFGNRAGLYKYRDNATKQHKIGWRIPSTRVYGQVGSENRPRAMRLFNRTPEQYARTMRTLRKKDGFREIYVYDKKSRNGNGLWIHLPFTKSIVT